MLPARALLVAALVGQGCYSAPTTTPALDLTIPDGDYHADGTTTIVLSLKVNAFFPTAQTVMLEVSSGILDSSADPTSAAAHHVELSTKGGQELTTPLRVGLQAGQVVIRAAVAGLTLVKTIDLKPVSPSTLTLTANRTAAVADGVTQVQITATVGTGNPNTLVSARTPIYFAACCLAGAVPAPCLAAPPIDVPDQALTDETQKATVQATPFRESAPDAGITRVAILGALNARPTCGTTTSMVMLDLVAP